MLDEEACYTWPARRQNQVRRVPSGPRFPSRDCALCCRSIFTSLFPVRTILTRVALVGAILPIPSPLCLGARSLSPKGLRVHWCPAVLGRDPRRRKLREVRRLQGRTRFWRKRRPGWQRQYLVHHNGAICQLHKPHRPRIQTQRPLHQSLDVGGHG